MVKDDTLHLEVAFWGLLIYGAWISERMLCPSRSFQQQKFGSDIHLGTFLEGRKPRAEKMKKFSFAMQIQLESQGSLAFLVGGALALGNSLLGEGICSIWRNSPKISPLLTNKLTSVFHDSMALLAMLLTRYT